MSVLSKINSICCQSILLLNDLVIYVLVGLLANPANKTGSLSLFDFI